MIAGPEPCVLPQAAICVVCGHIFPENVLVNGECPECEHDEVCDEW